jgi:two-component system, cell cycle response regulator DivK
MPDGRLILNVEDNLENRILIRRLLMSEDYQVLEAENAQQAYKILEQTIPDLILMDINMPEIDGYTLTRELKNRPNYQKIPIIAITANVMRGDRERVFNSGCDGYIEKPIDVDRFLDQISKYFSQPAS